MLYEADCGRCRNGESWLGRRRWKREVRCCTRRSRLHTGCVYVFCTFRLWSNATPACQNSYSLCIYISRGGATPKVFLNFLTLLLLFAFDVLLRGFSVFQEEQPHDMQYCLNLFVSHKLRHAYYGGVTRLFSWWTHRHGVFCCSRLQLHMTSRSLPYRNAKRSAFLAVCEAVSCYRTFSYLICRIFLER